MTEYYTAKDAIVKAALSAAEAAVQDLLASEQIHPSDRFTLLSSVEKALGGIEDSPALVREVSKALDYGLVTTDGAYLTGGGAATAASLSDYQKRKKIDELLRDTEKGLTPFVAGFAFSDDPLADVAEFVQSEMGVMDDDDALDISEGFFVKIVALGQ